MKLLFTFAFSLLFISFSSANCNCTNITVTVNTLDDLIMKINQATNSTNIDANYTIIIEDGNYHTDYVSGNNQQLVKTIDRNTDCKYIIRAESIGGVKITGKIYLGFAKARNVEIIGIHFQKTERYGSNKSPTVRLGNSDYCSILNCTFSEDQNNLPDLTNYYIDIVRGNQYLIDSCNFMEKFTKGHFINNSDMDEDENRNQHQIINNYFGKYQMITWIDQDGDCVVGKSSYIKIGSCGEVETSTAHIFSKYLVANNYFEEYNHAFELSDTCAYFEIISNKSSGNIFIGNTFINCNGELTIRCGADIKVDGNRFIRTDENYERSFGVRVSGPNHKIINNYFENLSAPPFSIYSGNIDFDAYPENPIEKPYFNTENCDISFNTFVNCNTQSVFNSPNASTIYTPLNNTINNNIIYHENFVHPSFIRIDDLDNSIDINDWNTNKFNHNIYYSPTSPNLTDWDYPPSTNSTNFTVDPLLIYNSSENIYVPIYTPSTISPAIDNSYLQANNPEKDIVPKLRDEILKDIGCFESKSSIIKPPNKFSNPIDSRTKIRISIYPNPFKNSIFIENLLIGDQIDIFSVRQKLIYSNHSTQEKEFISLSLLPSGVYFININGKFNKKIIKI